MSLCTSFFLVNRQRNWGPMLSYYRSQAETEELLVILYVLYAAWSDANFVSQWECHL